LRNETLRQDWLRGCELLQHLRENLIEQEVDDHEGDGTYIQIGQIQRAIFARVEKAKNLLLNPNMRISEVAFAAGFQSLSHFNRVFRRIAGESPTRYREKLPSA
jgi:AraC-like DNA-binding protein